MPGPYDPADPEQRAVTKARADTIMGNLDHAALDHLTDRARREPNPHAKVIWIRRSTLPLKDATRGYVACRDECSHCCSIPVMMTLTEAQVIAKETGRALTVPLQFTAEPNDDYTGTPCPFLAGTHCGIYQSRPIACRLQYSVWHDAEPCRLDSIKQVPLLNPMIWNVALLMSLGAKLGQQIADIRDFFPPASPPPRVA